MRWIEIGLSLFLIFSKINILSATQALLCSLTLGLAHELNAYVYHFLLSPLVIFVVVALSLELVHFIHKEKSAMSRSVWRHVQDLRSKQDLELLLILASGQNLITLRDRVPDPTAAPS
jgi:quinol-cytochrome oxidoreductase complex cytochrome b subunit